MKRILAVLCLLSALLVSGCWDRIELEDQLFLIVLGVDQGSVERYRVTARAIVFASLHAGVLGGREGGAPPAELMTVEADSLAQAVYVINSSTSRRISVRHVRAIMVGEGLAREGLSNLLAELIRSPEFRPTAGFLVARGKASEVMHKAKWPGEFNAARVPEGIMLVQKQLHMSPAVRVHHMVNRSGGLGINAFAPVVAVNQQVLDGDGETGPTESAVAGDQQRMQGNPVEVAGAALFRQGALVGYLTVDETQAMLALRGEMGKAYVTIPSPFAPGETLLLRFQQENLPQYQAAFTQDGPSVSVRLLFEGEVLSGHHDYREEKVRNSVERAAKEHMEGQLRSALRKMREWKTDPVGFGLLFRGRFPRWRDWAGYKWDEQVEHLQVKVEAKMRIRRHGLTLGAQKQLQD